MNKRTKTLSAIASIFILSGFLAECTARTGSSNSKAFVIAVVESNPVNLEAPDPQSAYTGVKLALDQIRERKGGINVQVKLYSDKGDPRTAALIASEIANSEAIAVIGHSSMETSNAAAVVYDSTRIPVVNFVPVTEHLTEQDPYYFNTTYTAESEAAYIANYVINLDDKVTAGVIYASSSEDLENQKEFRNEFAALGGVVTIREMIDLGNAGEVVPQVSETPSESGTTESQNSLTEIELASVEPQLNTIASKIAGIPQVDKPQFLFVTAADEITARLEEILNDKGVSIPIRGVDILDQNDAALKDLFKEDTASIISTDDDYSQTLALSLRVHLPDLAEASLLKKPSTMQIPGGKGWMKLFPALFQPTSRRTTRERYSSPPTSRPQRN